MRGCYPNHTPLIYSIAQLRLELLAHKPARKVTADIVADDGPQPRPEHHHVEASHDECYAVVVGISNAVRKAAHNKHRDAKE